MLTIFFLVHRDTNTKSKNFNVSLKFLSYPHGCRIYLDHSRVTDLLDENKNYVDLQWKDRNIA